MSEFNKTPIRLWATDDKPREKLLNKGKSSLSDAELIAILIRSGNAKESAVELSRRILRESGDNLVNLSRLSFADLTKFNGIGEAKSLSIIAALELGNRRRSAEAHERKIIRSSKDAYEAIYAHASYHPYEKFWTILLDQPRKVIRIVEISEGGIAGTVVDQRKIFKAALEHNATSIILCHNHPSGSLMPSDADKKITEKITQSGELLNIPVLDHLIIGENTYFSFADQGML